MRGLGDGINTALGFMCGLGPRGIDSIRRFPRQGEGMAGSRRLVLMGFGT